MKFSSTRFLRIIIMVGVLMTLVSGIAFAGGGGDDKAAKTKHGILLVAFGSSMPEGQMAIDAMEQAVKSAYPNVDVRVSFTSRIIMRKLEREEKRIVDEPAIALAKMAYEGYTHVAVMSTHIIPGAEYKDLQAVVAGFKTMASQGTKAGFRHIELSRPLLWVPEDFTSLADVLVKSYAKEAAEGAVVFVGHGTHMFADAAYGALRDALQRKSSNFFVGTVEGSPSYDDVLKALKKTRFRKVAVAPAMLVAGDHAHNDMGGDEDDSWKVMLTKEGYKVTPKLVGLGQNTAVQRLLLNKLREAWGENAPK